MTRFNLTLAGVLSAALLASSVPQIAQAGFTAADAAMQERSQLYVHTSSAIAELLEAATAYNVARSHDNRQEMQVSAAEMAAASSEAALLAAVLNAQVQTEGTNETAKKLAPQLASLTAQVENALDKVVASGDLGELDKVLDSDKTASALTQLASINRQVQQMLWG